MTTAEIGTATGAKVNRLAVVSVAAGPISVAGMFGFGFAVFAVGPGHVALSQIRRRRERGTVFAWAGLGMGYGVGVWSLLFAVRLLPVLANLSGP